MKKIKIFPAPHVEVRVHVSDQMEKDMRQCQTKSGVGLKDLDCTLCSWKDVKIPKTGLCELPEIINKVIGKEA